MPAPLEYVADGDWMRLRTNTDTTARLLNPPVPQARVYNDANISVNNATATALTFNSERFDNGDLHSTSSNTGRLTAPITGLYLIVGHVAFAANATGRRRAQIRRNGTQLIASNDGFPTAGDNCFVTVSALYQLNATDYVELVVEQASGGALNVLVLANHSPEFEMVRLAGYVNQGV